MSASEDPHKEGDGPHDFHPKKNPQLSEGGKAKHEMDGIKRLKSHRIAKSRA